MGVFYQQQSLMKNKDTRMRPLQDPAIEIQAKFNFTVQNQFLELLVMVIL